MMSLSSQLHASIRKDIKQTFNALKRQKIGLRFYTVFISFLLIGYPLNLIMFW